MSAADEAILKALESIYVACCLSCRHLAIRQNTLTGQYECDWCRMTIQEARQREFMRRLTRDNER